MDTNAALPTFVAESRELLEAMDAALLRLERSHGDAAALNEVFRATHTIGGARPGAPLLQEREPTSLPSDVLARPLVVQRAAIPPRRGKFRRRPLESIDRVATDIRRNGSQPAL